MLPLLWWKVVLSAPWLTHSIKHTVVLDDPVDDPPGLEAHVPDASPVFQRQEDDTRLEDDWVPSEDTRYDVQPT